MTADTQRTVLSNRNEEQAITALKRGAYLLKYGRKGKPKFCPFRLSNDETILIWYDGKEEKHLTISHVSRIVPGQRTAIFQRYPRPEKEYQSFSLIYNNRSLDLICKDKDEAENWLVALRVLISRGVSHQWRSEPRSSSVSSDSSSSQVDRNSQSLFSNSSSDTACKDISNEVAQKLLLPFTDAPRKSLARAFSDVYTYGGAAHGYPQKDSVASSPSSLSSGSFDSLESLCSAENLRMSLSSVISLSSQGSPLEDYASSGDVFIWGEGIDDGLLGGGMQRFGESPDGPVNALLPKPLEAATVLDVQTIACGSRHAVLVNKHGDVYSWGHGLGGRLGHGAEVDVSKPKSISILSGLNTTVVACGDYHSCAVTSNGDLYTWGDGSHRSGLLGHGSETGLWTPRKLCGRMEGIHISFVSCGPWHTAAITMQGQLFTFGDGTFGALGHGDLCSANVPKEVEALKGKRTLKVSCGFWHTAAIVEVTDDLASAGGSTRKLFTWGSGDKGQLGHGEKESRMVPSCVLFLYVENFCQVACGHSITVALTTSGHVYTMGSAEYGQLGNPKVADKRPIRVEGKIRNSFIEEVSCGSHHVAVLTSRSEVYTWGKGTNGQLGHGDNSHKDTPTFVEALRDKRVRKVVCGSNVTAAICLHTWVFHPDNSLCSGCHHPFNFRRKRHNCYNCGLVFCKACSSRKTMKASLAPDMIKPYRVCDDCFRRLNTVKELLTAPKIPRIPSVNHHQDSGEAEKKTQDPKQQKLLSRLSSFNSFKFSSRNNSKQERNSGSDSGQASSNTGSIRCGTSKFDSLTSTAAPGSTVYSRAASPVSTNSTPPHPVSLSPCRESSSDYFKERNEGQNDEVSFLRSKVEDLTRKSQLLEAELERALRQLKEANESAREEKEKTKAAKNLKDMAERVPQEDSLCTPPNPLAGTNSTTLSLSSTWNHLSCNPFLGSYFNRDILIPTSSSGSVEHSEKLDWALDHENGACM